MKAHWDECALCRKFWWNTSNTSFCTLSCARTNDRLKERPEWRTDLYALIEVFLAQPEVPKSQRIRQAAFRIFGKP